MTPRHCLLYHRHHLSSHGQCGVDLQPPANQHARRLHAQIDHALRLARHSNPSVLICMQGRLGMFIEPPHDRGAQVDVPSSVPRQLSQQRMTWLSPTHHHPQTRCHVVMELRTTMLTTVLRCWSGEPGPAGGLTSSASWHRGRQHRHARGHRHSPEVEVRWTHDTAVSLCSDRGSAARNCFLNDTHSGPTHTVVALTTHSTKDFAYTRSHAVTASERRPASSRACFKMSKEASSTCM